MPIHKVMLAKPYRMGAMGSLLDGAYMLIKQHNFPLQYDTCIDFMVEADHDRIMQWDYKHAREVIKDFTGTGELGLEDYFRKAYPGAAIKFLSELFKTRENPRFDGAKWTGYRCLGTVHRGNGYPVYSLSLFANNSNQKVYSESHAPNVEPMRGDEYELTPWGSYRRRAW